MKEVKVAWTSPSNIAIVKYWGKYGRQLPRNTSISFTLSQAVSKTQMTVSLKEKKSNLIDLKFFFEGIENPKFGEKSAKFMNSITDIYPELFNYSFIIESSNTFPHSSGIASSASGMSAISLCILDAMAIIKNGELPTIDNAFRIQASFLSRLGSGSACRSIYPEMAIWGKHSEIKNSSQDYAIPWNIDIHDVFRSYHDDILIVSKSEKSVSSTAGHGLMEGNPYASARYLQAQDRMVNLIEHLKNGDVHSFGEIAEDEALTLHALMMCSKPSYILMEAASLSIIQKIRSFRKETKLPLYFTLDAGPNIHLLYPAEISSEVKGFISDELLAQCHQNTVINDKVGNGPERIIC